MNLFIKHKRLLFCTILLTCVILLAAVVWFQANFSSKQEFPINGINVSELDTARVIEMIGKAKKLDDGSQLCVSGDNFELMFTPDFNWANDGAIRFFYLKNQKHYSAQLRMFHDENKYFITDSNKCGELTESFKLIHYLDSFKYIPQEEIRQLSPEADRYLIVQQPNGTPNDYDRVLEYNQNGIVENSGWNIHLVVQPLHEVAEGGYNGSGDELIHLFYNHLTTTESLS